nr:hypothetical protein [Acinetobacter sp. Marseille-Q1620]
MQNFLTMIAGGAWFAICIPLFVILCTTYKKIKDSEMFQDIFGMYHHLKSKKIMELKKNLESPYLSETDKAAFQYELQTAILQRDLNINEENLFILKYFKSLVHSHFAARIYKNCRSLVHFNEETQGFELIRPISFKEAKKSENIGAALFSASGIFAYLFMIYMLYFVDIGIDLKQHTHLAIIWGTISLILMISIIYIGSMILKFFMRKSNALKLLELPKKNLNIVLPKALPSKNIRT